jgi:hypothetical protein
MKREWSWGVAGVLALAATAGVSLQRGGSSHGGENAAAEHRVSEKENRHASAKPAVTDEKYACDDIAEALEFFLAIDADVLPRPASCFDPAVRPSAKGPKIEKEPPGVYLKFVIATLPDPVHTHLPLMFDRMTEVIQQAAQDEDYSYEESWLPWEDKEDSHDLLVDDDEAAKRKELRERQPGILLFRRNTKNDKAIPGGIPKDWPFTLALRPYQDRLIVFVVGEDPTRGIHIEQFTNALGWIDDLRDLDTQGRARTAILGPAFSGSFPSLAKLLTAHESAEHLEKIRRNSATPLTIYSGTANSEPVIEGFKNSLKNDPKLQRVQATFQNLMEYDEVGLERYCRFVNQYVDDKPPAHHNPLRLAVISEDETAYGGKPSEAPSSNACMAKALRLTIVMGILCLFLATAAAISSYPFYPRQGLSGSMLALFAVLATIIFYVYAQMHRDATLSHVTNTKPGELGSDFWFKVLGFGLAPLLGLLTTVFPSISDFVFSWLQPGLQSIK